MGRGSVGQGTPGRNLLHEGRRESWEGEAIACRLPKDGMFVRAMRASTNFPEQPRKQAAVGGATGPPEDGDHWVGSALPTAELCFPPERAAVVFFFVLTKSNMIRNPSLLQNVLTNPLPPSQTLAHTFLLCVFQGCAMGTRRAARIQLGGSAEQRTLFAGPEKGGRFATSPATATSDWIYRVSLRYLLHSCV